MVKTFKKSVKGTFLKIKRHENYLKCWNFPGEIQEFPQKNYITFSTATIFSKKGKIRIRLFSPGA